MKAKKIIIFILFAIFSSLIFALGKLSLANATKVAVEIKSTITASMHDGYLNVISNSIDLMVVEKDGKIIDSKTKKGILLESNSVYKIYQMP